MVVGGQAGGAVEFPLENVVRDALVELAEAVDGPEVLARAGEGPVVEEEVVVLARLHERVPTVEDVVEVGLEAGPPVTDPLQPVPDQAHLRPESSQPAEIVPVQSRFVRPELLEGEGSVVLLVEEAARREDEDRPVPGRLHPGVLQVVLESIQGRVEGIGTLLELPTQRMVVQRAVFPQLVLDRLRRLADLEECGVEARPWGGSVGIYRRPSILQPQVTRNMVPDRRPPLSPGEIRNRLLRSLAVGFNTTPGRSTLV